VGARSSSPLPSLSPRVGVRVGVGVRVRVGLRLLLVYLMLEHEVLWRRGLRSHDKILCSDWSPPLLVEELACRHVGQAKLLFKNAALYVKSCVETFFSVKVMETKCQTVLGHISIRQKSVNRHDF